MPDRRIATRVSQLNGEGALAVFSRAKELERQGRSIIHLELGEPDFHPAVPVVDSLRNAVASGRDRYCATRGIPALREEITTTSRALEVFLFNRNKFSSLPAAKWPSPSP